MKKGIIFLLIIILATTVGGLLGREVRGRRAEEAVALVRSLPQVSPIPSPTPVITFLPPSQVHIPKLQIVANVEAVGLDPEGRMDVPQNAANVGWFKLGYKAGEKGSVVLAGHFDDVTGAPAVFYNLSLLNQGDEVILTDQKNKQYTYRVVDKRVYSFDSVPLEQVFDSKDKVRLNLITCDGFFDYGSRNYSQRLVVFTELVS